MSVTISDLMKSVSDSEIRLIAGSGGMNNVVSWVHVVENTQISEFLEGQEIAFTTGVGIECERDLFDIVQYNYRMHASAMIINIGPFIKQIPEEVIRFGNEHDFPLFEVPWHVHMSKLMRTFSAILIQNDNEQIILSEAIKNAINDPLNENMYIPTLEKFSFMRGWSYCVCGIVLEDDQGNAVSKNIFEYQKRVIERSVTHEYNNSAVVEMDNMILILLADYTQEKAEAILKNIYQKVCSLLPENLISYWGVGESTKSVRCLWKSYKKSVNSIKLQKKQGLKNQITYYSEMGIYKILMAVEDDNALKTYWDETLGRLVEYDRVSNTHLYDELRLFLLHDGNYQKTADALFMHRNSIRYKIRKIDEILGVDLESQKDRTKIILAFEIENII